jgi:hypothetical protein
MNNLLEIRIRQVYPTGLLWEFDENQLGKNDQAARIELALSSVTKTASLRVVLDPGNDPLYALAITHTDDPAFGEWIWTMRNPDKTAWCKTNNRPYVVFWLRISRVADYFRFFYNHWRPRGDTGYMDADTRVTPSEEWKQYESAICARFEENGFSLAPHELLNERVAFVLEAGYDEIPEDDPRWDDDDFSPPTVPASVYQCLFGDH